MRAILLLLLLALPLRAAPIAALAFSPDGTVLVSNGDRCVEVRSPKDAIVQRRIECDLPKITSLAFHPRGRLLAVGGGEPGVSGETRIFSWPKAKMIGGFGRHSDLVTAIAFNADGSQLAASSMDRSARLWSIADDGSATEQVALRGHSLPVLGIAFGPSGIVTASADRSLKVWEPAGGTLLRSLNRHTHAIHAVAFSPGGVECASAAADATVRIWQPETGRMVRIIRRHTGPVFALAWKPDGKAIFSAGRDGVIRLLDSESDEVLSEWNAVGDWIYALAISPDGASLASGDWQGNVKLHDARQILRPASPPAAER